MSSVELGLDCLRGVESQSEAIAAAHRVLDTIGHNHAGLLYARAELAVEPLLAIALGPPSWSASAAMDVLTDMVGAFQPAKRAAEGQQVPAPRMKQRIRAAISERRVELTELSGHVDEFKTAAHALALLAELDGADAGRDLRPDSPTSQSPGGQAFD